MSKDNDEVTEASNPLAYVLWVIVGGFLIFGIARTVITATALFTS